MQVLKKIDWWDRRRVDVGYVRVVSLGGKISHIECLRGDVECGILIDVHGEGLLGIQLYLALTSNKTPARPFPPL